MNRAASQEDSPFPSRFTWQGKKLVEAAGIEPASEGRATGTSTGLAPVFISQRRLPGAGSAAAVSVAFPAAAVERPPAAVGRLVVAPAFSPGQGERGRAAL